MKRTISIIAMFAGIVALGYCGDINEKILTCSFTTNTTAKVTATDSTMKGYIEEILLDVPAVTTMTNLVTLVAIDKAGGSTTIATGSLTADKRFKPVFADTDTLGASTNTNSRMLLLGETLSFSVTNVLGGSVSMSNATFRAIIKTSK